MNWDKKSIKELCDLFRRKYLDMRTSSRTDRRNFSAIWNKYLSGYNAEVLVNFKESGEKTNVLYTLSNIIDIVNLRNELVADAVVIPNPDRNGQYILIPRDMAARIMVLGLL